jgi:hypothetical protein
MMKKIKKGKKNKKKNSKKNNFLKNISNFFLKDARGRGGKAYFKNAKKWA